jgi:predicted ArsR family transcriptional regulator
MSDDTPRSDDIRRVAMLDEPTRRRLYQYVLGQDHAVGRDEAATGTGISRGLAAFHLDRLVAGGLLEVEYRRLSSRTGRGAGRPAKLYRRGDRRVLVSLPETKYDLAGTILVRSLAEQNGDVGRTAGERGRELGREMAPRVGRARTLRRAARALGELGFEPHREPGMIRLRNCPFHALVQEDRDLVCSLNLALLSGLIEGLGCRGVEAEVDPEPDGCCVRVRAESKDRGHSAA